jgi:hypothetical protein
VKVDVHYTTIGAVVAVAGHIPSIQNLIFRQVDDEVIVASARGSGGGGDGGGDGGGGGGAASSMFVSWLWPLQA